MKFNIITLFPDAIKPYLDSSMLWKAQKDKKIKINLINPRDFTLDSLTKLGASKRRQVDDRPYGGGPGMVLKAEPILRAIKSLNLKPSTYPPAGRAGNLKPIILSPRGKQFTNKLADNWAKKYNNLVLIAGHYEGIDARVKKILSARGGSAFGGKAEEISIGPYTLTGGELPVLVIVDAVTRRLPGVLGDPESLEESRVAPNQTYTRPEVINYKNKKYRVPSILLSGHAAKIAKWRASSKK